MSLFSLISWTSAQAAFFALCRPQHEDLSACWYDVVLIPGHSLAATFTYAGHSYNTVVWPVRPWQMALVVIYTIFFCSMGAVLLARTQQTLLYMQRMPQTK
jgi:hypothetical protein